VHGAVASTVGEGRRRHYLLFYGVKPGYSWSVVTRRLHPKTMSFDFAATSPEPALPASLPALLGAPLLAPPPVVPALPPPSRSPAVSAEPAATPVISVGELDRRLKRLIEGDTAGVYVEGEVSGLRAVASGHIYFTLKDEQEEASIDAVMYRTAPPRSRRLLADGARVVLIGRATVYAPRGRLQFTADEARPAGRGALLEALERLKEKLAGEGLFAAERKRPLPADPRIIGVVTSASGAALHDIIKVASRRGRVRVVLAPAQVQGATAAAQMVRALDLLAQMPEIEAIILGRGGGSADDLAAFNDELLVRKVAASRVPIVSAVGHEVDTTLTDLAADARAATPSQAAELLVADAEARADALDHLRVRLERALDHRLAADQAALDRLRARLGTPQRLLGEQRRDVDDALERIEDVVRAGLAAKRSELGKLERRLAARHPSMVLAGARASLGPLAVRLGAAARRRLAAQRLQLGEAAACLDALSPLAVLGRGYAIAQSASGAALRDAAEATIGDIVNVRVHRGTLVARVLSTSPSSPSSPSPEGSRNA
jgi:exodeoxyribonuclease VII large subunit